MRPRVRSGPRIDLDHPNQLGVLVLLALFLLILVAIIWWYDLPGDFVGLACALTILASPFVWTLYHFAFAIARRLVR